jgi:hypothetical protein
LIYIILGHYGAGKTNFACNLALKLAERGKTAIADLDIVNPYFRTADYANLLENAGVKVIASDFQTSTLDIPSLTFDLASEAELFDNFIIDVGGDDEGAKALGRYIKGHSRVASIADKPRKTLYVVNFRRYLTRTSDEAFELLEAIEFASGVKADMLVNNTNLAEETTAEVIAESFDECKKLVEKMAENREMPPESVITAIPEGISLPEAPHPFPIKVIVNKPWQAAE